MENTSKAPCPLCGGLIDLMNLSFTCPACSTKYENWNLMKNCDFCRFAPNYLCCPHCKNEFELMLLLGDYKDKKGNIIPPQPRKKYEDKFAFILGKLDIRIHGSVEKETIDRFGEDALIHLFQTIFTFPFEVAMAVIHTVHISSDNRRWFHIWLTAGNSDDLLKINRSDR